MRFQMNREFYLPKTETLAAVDCTGTDAAIWTYEAAGAVYAIGFHGKAQKPDFHHRFRDAARRSEHIAGYLEGRKSYAVSVAERKSKRSAPHTLKVGDVLVSSWGYDQTNIDYYQVTRVPGTATVEIRQIAKSSSGENGFMTADCTAARDNFIGEPMVKRANSENSVRIASYAHAHPWDGKADRYSWYA
jgi:hypothetical protein